MIKEVMGSLNLKEGQIVLDATVGGGGHAVELLKKVLPGGKLIGLDADPEALKISEVNLKEYSGSFKLINGNFRNLDIALSGEGLKAVDAVLFDLGMSSYQLDSPSRGFGIKKDERLDMRMDPCLEITAHDIVNRYKERDLSSLIERFGEERFHNRIAHLIVTERSKAPIETTGELASIVKRAVGARYKNTRIDPATRTFQAIRIAVNDELGALEEGLKKAISWLDLGGRVCVISFHSLEDRIVKNLFRGYSDLGVLNRITKKPLRPTGEEIGANPRARSARLRAAERI